MTLTRSSEGGQVVSTMWTVIRFGFADSVYKVLAISAVTSAVLYAIAR